VAEVRSLAVDRRARGLGVGTMIVDELRQRARREGSRTRPPTSARWGSRSCRTSGCRRRSSPTA
jgi:GNAT superfamily N-acetyltransferase